jgi:hypothetical protein
LYDPVPLFLSPCIQGLLVKYFSNSKLLSSLLKITKNNETQMREKCWLGISRQFERGRHRLEEDADKKEKALPD